MGVVTAKTVGLALIVASASCCNVADTVEVRVTQVPAEVVVSPSSYTLAEGESYQLSGVVKDAMGYVISDLEVTWASDNPSVATVDQVGTVEGVDGGSVHIRGTYESLNDEAAVTVTESASPPPQSDGTPFFSESFESGDLSNSMNGWSWSSPNRTQVSELIARTGKYSLRFRYPGGDPGTDSHAEQRFSIGRKLTEFWLEYWIYFPDGTEGIGSAKYQIRADESPHNNKFLRVWGPSYNDGGKIGFSMWRTTPPNTNLMFEYRSPRGSYGALTGSPRISPYLHETDGPAIHGVWHQLRVHAKFATTVDSYDGVLEFWINGVFQDGKYDLGIHGDIAGGGWDSFWSQGYFMGWANSGFDENTYVFIDDINWWDSAPGWQ